MAEMEMNGFIWIIIVKQSPSTKDDREGYNDGNLIPLFFYQIQTSIEKSLNFYGEK